MKKIILVLIAVMISSPVFADWSQKDRSHFSELLWLPAANETVDLKIRMFRFIACITSYYEEHYPFSKVLEQWNSTVIDTDFLSEFVFVNDRCNEKITNNEDVKDI